MNKQSSLAPVTGPVTPLAGPVTTYQYRTVECELCDTATSSGCSECDRGEVDAACADCHNVAPLNDDGLCRYCNDCSYLTTVQMAEKWLHPGVLRNPEMRVEF